LILRPFTMNDAAVIQRLLNDPQVSDGLLSVSYPFALPDATKWLADRITNRFGIALRDSGELCGGIGIHTNRNIARRNGLLARARLIGARVTQLKLRCAVRYGFECLHLQRIAAMHFPRNTASKKC